jgi:hypothetical protein
MKKRVKRIPRIFDSRRKRRRCFHTCLGIFGIEADMLPGSLGVLLLKLGARLKQFEQSDAEMEAGTVVSARKEPFQDFGLHLSEQSS